MVRSYRTISRRTSRRKRYTPRKTYRKYRARSYTRGFRVFARDGEIKYNTLNRSFGLSVQSALTGAGVEFAMAATENTSVSAVGQGATAETRVGNAVKAKWLEIAGQATATSLATDEADSGVGGETIEDGNKSRTQFRIIVFRDNQFNSTEQHIPTLGNNVLQGGVPLVNSMVYIPNMGRFQIIGQKWLDCDNSNPSKSFRMRINLKNITMRYNGPTAGSLLQSNRIHVAVVAFTPAALTTSVQLAPNFTYSCRMAFSDL